MHHPGTSIYLRKDAKGLDLTKLSFINNQLYEDKLTTLALLNNLGSKCTIYSKDQKNNINYCYKESPQEFILFDPIYKDKAEIYDLR
jgi:hypothetical protein